MILQNLHTHSTFDDGKSSLEEMIQTAISMGFTSLGLSVHRPMRWGTDGWAMDAKNTDAYYAAVKRLQKEYEGRFGIFCGLEQDMDADPPPFPCDYIIGSIHYVYKDGLWLGIDRRHESTMRIINQYFDGDPYAYTENYYERLSQIVERTGCDIVGHFDIITKFNENSLEFDESHPRYRKAAMDALDAIMKHDVVFEINTGAMAKGWRSVPYPSADILRAINQRKGRICITSDCHLAEKLTYSFDLAREIARNCGFKETWELTKEGFVPQAL